MADIEGVLFDIDGSLAHVPVRRIGRKTRCGARADSKFSHELLRPSIPRIMPGHILVQESRHVSISVRTGRGRHRARRLPGSHAAPPTRAPRSALTPDARGFLHARVGDIWSADVAKQLASVRGAGRAGPARRVRHPSSTPAPSDIESFTSSCSTRTSANPPAGRPTTSHRCGLSRARSRSTVPNCSRRWRRAATGATRRQGIPVRRVELVRAASARRAELRLRLRGLRLRR